MYSQSSRSLINCLVAVAVALGCSNPSKQSAEGGSCKYLNGFSLYLSNSFGEKLSESKENLFYLLPLESCEPCLSLHLDLLVRLKNPDEKIILVLIGNNYVAEFQRKLETVENKYRCLRDPKKLVFQYETGLSKPVIFHLKGNECKYGLVIQDQDLPAVESYLNSKL